MIGRFALPLLFISVSLAQQTGAVGDWPDWRGPDRDGISREKGLPEKWSLAGDNLAWKVPYGGRSTPIILGDHLYLENTFGARETEQERLMCFNADSGKLLLEYKFNLYQSDVPAHRVGWASPLADPETGNIYSFGVNNLVTALTRDGKKVWERSITEEFAPFTTHGLPHDRRQPGNRQYADIDLGHAGQPRTALHRDGQTHGRHCVDQYAGRAAVRHQLRSDEYRHRERHAIAAHRRSRRRGAGHEAADRRAGLQPGNR